MDAPKLPKHEVSAEPPPTGLPVGLAQQDSPYLKKTVRLRLGRSEIDLAVAHGLFSSHAIDAGSRRLLRTLVDASPPTSILDVGCGYGPLGLGLKVVFPDARLDMIDRDALAVAFASANAQQCGASDSTVYGSLGYDDVSPDRKFDLVVSNIPGKAGEGAIEHLVIGAGNVLNRAGTAAIVVVAALTDWVGGLMDRNAAEVLRREDGRDYSVFHYRPVATEAKTSSFENGSYTRATKRFSRGPIEWRAATVWGLSEFDTLGFHTGLAIDLLVASDQTGPRSLVINPGQGHLAAAAALSSTPSSMSIVGRDLLALRTSLANLQLNGLPTDAVDLQHEVAVGGIRGKFDLAILTIPEKQPIDITISEVADAAARLAARARLVLAGRSTAVTRVLESAAIRGLEVRERVRMHGFSAARLRQCANGG